MKHENTPEEGGHFGVTHLQAAQCFEEMTLYFARNLNQVSCADNFTDNLSSWDSMCSLFLQAFKNWNLINALLSYNINAPSDDEVSHVVN